MSSATHSAMRAPGTRRPQGRRGFARGALVLAWVVFWLNTALFPCREAVAAAIGGYPGSVSQSVSNVPPMHDYGAASTYPERPDPGPYPPCGYALSAAPASAGVYAALATDHSPLEWFAIDAPVLSRPVAAKYSSNSTPHEISPPPVRLYLRELRLLI